MVIADCHTHSKFSNDGKSTIEENVKIAIEKGLKQIAVTEHCYGHINGIKKSDFNDIKEEVYRLRNKYPRIDILFGMEIDLLDEKGNVSIDDEDLNQLDFVILGFHRNCGVLKYWFNHMKMRFIKTEKQRQRNTNAYLNVMDKYKINVLAHLNYGCKIDVEKIARKAKEKGCLIELNRKRILFNESEVDILKSLNVDFIASSDAHSSDCVGANFKAVNFMIKNNIAFDKLVNWNKILKIQKNNTN